MSDLHHVFRQHWFSVFYFMNSHFSQQVIDFQRLRYYSRPHRRVPRIFACKSTIGKFVAPIMDFHQLLDKWLASAINSWNPPLGGGQLRMYYYSERCFFTKTMTKIENQFTIANCSLVLGTSMKHKLKLFALLFNPVKLACSCIWKDLNQVNKPCLRIQHICVWLGMDTAPCQSQ